MKKQTLIVIASLALLSGCGGKSKEVATPVPAPAAAVTPNVAAAPKPLSAPPPNEARPQTVASAPDLATGEKVYKGTCSICHKSGLKGAPRLGKKQDWEARLAQGNEVLYDRAINGYIGKKGSMPSRGSNARLSEYEVKAAVDYMVVHAIPSWEWGN